MKPFPILIRPDIFPIGCKGGIFEKQPKQCRGLRLLPKTAECRCYTKPKKVSGGPHELTLTGEDQKYTRFDCTESIQCALPCSTIWRVSSLVTIPMKSSPLTPLLS